MKRLIVRTSDGNDIEAIHRLCRRFLTETSYGVLLGNPADENMNVLITQTQAHGVVLVAEIDGSIEGFIAIFALNHPMTQEPYGDELAWWVNPEHRNGRVGYYLLRAAEDWARQMGLKMLKLVAPARPSDVGTFLARRGFTEVEVTYHKRLD